MSSFVEEKAAVKNIEYCRVKEGVRVICNNAFSECKKLRHIGLPSSLNFIGKYAFKGCKSLDKIELPESLVYIGDGAFCCEDHFRKRSIPFRVTIPPSVETIEGNPFCNNTIIFSHNERFKVVDKVLYSSDGKVLISYCSAKEVFEVPDGVERIGVGAFRDTPIRKISFPESLKIIDKEAFKSAEKLENVKFPNSLKEIRKNAFKWCSFKTNAVTFPCNIEKIDPDAFGFDWYIKMIKVPKGYLEYYKSILPDWISNQIYEDDSIYENNLYLSSDRTEVITATSGTKDFEIPEGVVTIRDNAFDSIYYIDSIKLPSTLNSITRNAFDKEIQELKSIIVPKGMKEKFVSMLPDFEFIIKEE